MTEDPKRPIKLASYSTELQANMLATALEAEGLVVEVVGGPTAGFRAEAPGEVMVLVRADDREAAERIMAAHESEKAAPEDIADDEGDDTEEPD